MKFNELHQITQLLNIDKPDSLYVADLAHFSQTNRIKPIFDSHNLIEIGHGDSLSDETIGMIDDSFKTLEAVKTVFKVEDDWRMIEGLPGKNSSNSEPDNVMYIYIPPQEDKLSTERFVELIAHLRSPQGCPWDRKQTHQSLRTNLLEETYEVLEAIDSDDPSHLREELGDLLLQIVLQSQIAEEGGFFDYGNIVQDIFQKIRNRHPHVFRDVEVNGVGDVMANWEKIKEEERKHKDEEVNGILSSIPKALPALSVAQKYQERAARVGFDWEDIAPVFEKVDEEIEEIKNSGRDGDLEEELGDLLFAVVNLIRWSGFDAESVLRNTNKKFKRRFQYIEERLSDNGRSLSNATLSEMDALWDEAKANGL